MPKSFSRLIRESAPMPEIKANVETKLEKPPSSERNIFTNTDATVNAVMTIESDMGRLDIRRWARDFKEEIVPEILASLERSKNDDNLPDNEIAAGFQGLGGGNRWGITKSGEVMISESHCGWDTVELAKKLGFKSKKYLA